MLTSSEENREDYWKELLKRWEGGGLGLEKWCRTHAHPYYQARYWKRKLYRWNVEKAFVEVEEPLHGKGHIRICVGGVEIDVSAGFDMGRQLLSQRTLRLGTVLSR